MRIGIFYKHFRSKGGFPRDFQRLASELAAIGNEIFVYTYAGDADNEIAECNYIVREYTGNKRPSFSVPQSLAHLLRKNKDNLDILEVVGGFFPENIMVCRFARQSGVPYVYAPLGHLVPNVISSKNSIAKKVFLFLFLRKALSGAAALHCFSEFDKINALKWVKKTVVMTALGAFFEDIPGELGSDYFRSRILSFDGRAIFLYFGRIDFYKKGIDIIIDAMGMVGPLRHKIGFVIVGPGTEEDVIFLQHRIHEAGVGDSIAILPPVFDSSKFSMFADADFFVLPSRMDIIPRALREALSVGCPVLVSEETQAKDIVNEFGAGFIFKTDPIDLALTLSMVFKKREQWPSLRVAARRAAVGGLSWTRQAMLLNDGFKNTLNKLHNADT